MPTETILDGYINQIAWNISAQEKCVKNVNARETVKTSKFLSLVLRHQPERVGLKLDSAGWVGVSELLEAVNRHGLSLSIAELKQIVATNNKKRFALSQDGLKIRASQGHSVDVD